MRTKIHTAQIQSTTQNAELDYPAIRNQNGITVISGGYTRYKFNPEGVDGIDVNAKSGFYAALGIALAECELEHAELNRIDICWDFADMSYEQIYRLGKLLLYCMAVQIDYTDNISDNYDDFNIRKKSVKIQDTKDSGWRYQFELYNKKVQKPNQPIQARLELRRNQLADTELPELEKVDFVASEFVSILNAVVSDRGGVYTKTVQTLNNNLVEAWHREGAKSLRNFVNQHINSFLVKGQLTDFIRRVRPDIANASKRAQQIQEGLGVELYDKSDLAAFVGELIPALHRYLQA